MPINFFPFCILVVFVFLWGFLLLITLLVLQHLLMRYVTMATQGYLELVGKFNQLFINLKEHYRIGKKTISNFYRFVSLCIWWIT